MIHNQSLYSIEPLPVANLDDARQQVITVYRQAFALPPYERGDSNVQSFDASLSRHSQRKGYRMFVGRVEPSQRIVGFVYGYTSAPGQWWHDVVSGALTAEARAYWLKDSLEFTELAVLPEHQGQGLGGRLHDALLSAVPHRMAVLSTLRQKTNGQALYYKRGWQVIVPELNFPGSPRPYLIMGKVLKEK